MAYVSRDSLSFPVYGVLKITTRQQYVDMLIVGKFQILTKWISRLNEQEISLK